MPKSQTASTLQTWQLRLQALIIVAALWIKLVLYQRQTQLAKSKWSLNSSTRLALKRQKRVKVLALVRVKRISLVHNKLHHNLALITAWATDKDTLVVMCSTWSWPPIMRVRFLLLQQDPQPPRKESKIRIALRLVLMPTLQAARICDQCRYQSVLLWLVVPLKRTVIKLSI